MRVCRIDVLLFCLLAVCCHGDAALFQDGDRVCFVGDSITHSGAWHTYIYTYYATRFPDREIRVYNCGIGGHTAEKTLINFSWDVPRRKPTIVPIMLGMNDLRKGSFTKSVFEDYTRNLDQLVDRIEAETHAKIVYITPTPYDEYAEVKAANLPGFNAFLGQTVEYLRKRAQKDEAGYIDFYTPMTRRSIEGKKVDPEFTIIGSDRIHPGRAGNLLMAYLFLRAQSAPAVISEVNVDLTSGVITGNNCRAGELSKKEGDVSFSVLANALPWPIPKEAKKALQWAPIEREINRETVKVSGLQKGIYTLMIDDVEVGRYTAAEFAGGISLGMNEKTPQYQQALKVVELTEKKRQLEYMLGTEAMLKVALKKQGVQFDGSDRNAVYKMFERDEVKAMFAPSGPLGKGGTLRYWKRYQQEKHLLGDIDRQAKEIFRQIYQINQPEKRIYWVIGTQVE